MNQIASMKDYQTAAASLDDRLRLLKLYEQAAPLVPMGAWSCDLASERLDWTDGVFDIFGLSSDDALDRKATIELYCEESRELLERKRSQAIENRDGFTLDARIFVRTVWIAGFGSRQPPGPRTGAPNCYLE